MPDTAVAIRNPQRLDAVRRLRSMSPDRRQVMQRIVELASELADAPVGLLTLVGDDQQVFLAQSGLPAELAEVGSTPIEMSICQHAVAKGRPLILNDMAGDAHWAEHPAVQVFGVASYAGIPVLSADSQLVGTLCVLDWSPRDWTDEVLAKLALLADIISDEIELDSFRRRAEWERTWRAIPEYQRH